MSDVSGQKRHRAPRHGSLPVGTRRHPATSSRAATGTQAFTRSGGGATGGAGSAGGHVRRPNRHRASPWMVAHGRGAAATALSAAALVAITTAIVGGGRPAATGGGEWTTGPASASAPAAPSAGALSVPLPTASPTTGAGTRQPGRRGGGQGGRDRAHPGPKHSPGPPDRTPKQHPSPGRPPDAAVTAGPALASSPP